MNKNGHAASCLASALAFGALVMLTSSMAACTNSGEKPTSPEKPTATQKGTIVTPKPCGETGQAAPFHERHPDLKLHSWRSIALDTLTLATCVHPAEAVNLFAVDVYDNSERASFAVDFDNGYLYNRVSVAMMSSDDFDEPDMVLSAEALAELREGIDRHQVLDWPFRDPGEITYVGEYVNPNQFKLAVIFSDDTGSYADQQTKSDPDMVEFIRFAQSFLTKHLI